MKCGRTAAPGANKTNHSVVKDWVLFSAGHDAVLLNLYELRRPAVHYGWCPGELSTTTYQRPEGPTKQSPHVG